MKKLLTATLLLSASIVGTVHAAGYGIVDMQRVAEESSYLKQQNMMLKQTLEPQVARVEQLNKELQQLQEKATTAKENEIPQLKAQYEAKINEINTLEQTVQQKVQQTSKTTNSVFSTRLQQAAEALRKENSLDLVLNKNAALAYDIKSDLTDKMVQKVNSIK